MRRLLLCIAILLVVVELASGFYEVCTKRAKQETLSESVNKESEVQIAEFLKFFEECIANIFDFSHSDDYSQWNSVPSFNGKERHRVHINDKSIAIAANVAKRFFKTYDDWEHTVQTFRRDGNGQCKRLLLITAARYVYYLYVLRRVSEDAVHACEETGEDMETRRYVYPKVACYPVMYGSLTCTSDADVGLIGPQAGYLVDRFSLYFLEEYNKGSDKVMDTNMYSYSLEFTMPSLFINFDKKTHEIQALDSNLEFRVQDLIFALFQLYKYDVTYFGSVKEAICESLNEKGMHACKTWIKLILEHDANVPLRPPNREKSREAFWNAHQREYRVLVKHVADLIQIGEESTVEQMNNVFLSHLYASEAYHSRGSLRVVVGSLQMRRKFITENLSTLDYWCAMIEDWGNVNKVFHGECDGRAAGECLVLVSKYLWRVLYSMAELHKRTKIKKVVPSTRGMPGMEQIAKHWLYDFRKKGIRAIPVEYSPLRHVVNLRDGERKKEIEHEFAKCDECISEERRLNVFRRFLSDPLIEMGDADIREPLPKEFMNRMNSHIVEYSKILVEMLNEEKKT